MREKNPNLRTLIVTEREGYILRLGPFDVDALRFMDLIDKVEAQKEKKCLVDARHTLEAALRLVRGPFLEDVRCGTEIEPTLVTLTEYHRKAILLQIETALLRGKHDQILAKILAEWIKDRTRQDLAAWLMLAMYRCFRGTEALRVYDQIENVLWKEFGLCPNPRLQALRTRIAKADRESVEPAWTLDRL